MTYLMACRLQLVIIIRNSRGTSRGLCNNCRATESILSLLEVLRYSIRLGFMFLVNLHWKGKKLLPRPCIKHCRKTRPINFKDLDIHIYPIWSYSFIRVTVAYYCELSPSSPVYPIPSLIQVNNEAHSWCLILTHVAGWVDSKICLKPMFIGNSIFARELLIK